MSAPDAPRPKARRARGLMDRRGPGLAVERELIARIAGVYETWGFEPLETPAFEYADALGKFLPDQDRPNEGVFAFEDDEEWVALRYDLTAPLARFVAENFDALPKPYRRWAAGPVWRNEKPGPGRFREFWQCDADTVGSASPAADAEMIAMACAALEAAGVPRGQYLLKFSSRRLLDAVLQAIGVTTDSQRLVVLRSIDKLDRLGKEGVKELLGSGRKDESGDFTRGAGLSSEQIAIVLQFFDLNVMEAWSSGGADLYGFNSEEPPIQWVQTGFVGYPDNMFRLNNAAALLKQFPNGEEAVAEIATILEVLRSIGIGPGRCMFDPSIVRGLEYYTGAVFEAQLIGSEGQSFGSVGGGGRYDDLVARFRGERIPATGFSIGISRLAAALQAQAAAAELSPLVVFLPFSQEALGECFAQASIVRQMSDVRAEVYLGSSGPKAQLKYADKRGATIAAIIGGDELAAQKITLKNLKLGSQYAALAGDDREAWNKSRDLVQVEAPRDRLAEYVRASLDAVKGGN